MVATSDSQCRTFRYSLGTTVGVGGQGEFGKLALTLRVRQQKRTFRDNPGKLEWEADSADS